MKCIEVDLFTTNGTPELAIVKHDRKARAALVYWPESLMTLAEYDVSDFIDWDVEIALGRAIVMHRTKNDVALSAEDIAIAFGELKATCNAATAPRWSDLPGVASTKPQLGARLVTYILRAAAEYAYISLTIDTATPMIWARFSSAIPDVALLRATARIAAMHRGLFEIDLRALVEERMPGQHRS